MSLRYQIPGTSTNANLPILGFNEQEIVPGSLLYLEPARDGLSTTPAAGDTFANFARGSLAALTGEDMSACDATMSDVGSGAASRLERTSKNALHGFFDQTVASAGTQDFKIGLPQCLIDYIIANDGHEFYFDAIIRGTQDPVYNAAANSLAWMGGIFDGTSASDTQFGFKNQSDSDLSDANNHLIYPASSYDGVLFSGRDIWSDALSHIRAARESNATSLGSETVGEVAWVGPKAPGDILQGGSGFVFYNMYIEDCTASDRSYVDALAWRTAQYAIDFAEGGRYYGETWTDPASAVWS